jgi:hypothetical protein
MKSVLFGRSWRLTALSFGGAFLLAIGVFVLFTVWEIANLGAFIVTGLLFYISMLVLMLGVSALHAFRNDGLFGTLALAVAPLVGFYEARTILKLVGPVRPSVLEAFGIALLFGIPVGIVGLFLGTGARFLVSSQRGDHLGG